MISSPFRPLLLAIVVVLSTGDLSAEETAPILSPRNLEAPFCYLIDGQRTWSIFEAPLGPKDSIHFVAKQDGKALAEGEQLQFSGLHITTTTDRQLRIQAEQNAKPLSFQLTVRILRAKEIIQQQTLEVRPAPPTRPISYLSDLLDDLIRIYWDRKAYKFRPIEKSGLDQYFRRLQAQGISRLIVWQNSFPFTVQPHRLNQQDWSRYKSQAQAIIECQELTDGMNTPGLPSWKHKKMTLQLRLMPNFGEMLSRSATEHGIKLTASFRPFEPALTKYSEVPSFDENGQWL